MVTKKLTQKCESCLYTDKCYSKRTTPRNVVLNVLACRIRKDINRNESSKLLLKMIRPNLIKLISHARNKVGPHYIDSDNILFDLESRVIESLISGDGYRIGGPAYLTEYLFGTNPKTGWVRKWIIWSFTKSQRFHRRHTLIGIGLESETDDTKVNGKLLSQTNEHLYYTYEPDKSNKDTINAIYNIINDGITLNANEYRVISFCLSHANESNKTRLIDGMHTYLSLIMGVSRPRITRLFSVARAKIIKSAHEHNLSLQ